jgi:hypothetical protein
MKPTLTDAIKSLVGRNTAFSTANGKITNWDFSEIKSNVTQPTEAELETELARLQAAYDNAAYQRNRAAEYPSIGDQLDMIYHNGDGGATFQAAIKAVKDKYPKP